MKMDTTELVGFGRFISVLILSFGFEYASSSRDLALNKKATQSSTYNDGPHYYVASRAVDGVLGRDTVGGQCSHTGAGHNKAWWKVDLGQIYRIQMINITYRYSQTVRLKGYSLYVTNETDMTHADGSISEPSGHLCYHDTERGTPTYNQSRQCHVSGRYVVFYNKRLHEDAYVELCGVQVYGCAVGLKGDSCNEDCEHGTYGQDCSLNCHCATSDCNKQTGRCGPQGCTAGWTGTTCSQACDNGTFGQHCSQQCHCLKPDCDKQTGRCTGRCLAGWQGDSCNQACSNGTYGQGCSMNCHCATSDCNKQTGKCGPQGCTAGWTGTTCSQECSSGHFGLNCSEVCHCQKEGCNHINGKCDHVGCQAGWSGLACNIQCTSGYFGLNCSEMCHCQRKGCDHINGRCSYVGCQVGWSGQACDQRCVNDTFGRDCNQTCHCAVSSCDSMRGTCHKPGCKEGWHGDTCSQVESFQNQSAAFGCHDNLANTKVVAGYAILGTLLAIAIFYNIGLTLFCLRKVRRIKTPTKSSTDHEMQSNSVSQDNSDYEGLDITKVDSVKNIYDSIGK